MTKASTTCLSTNTRIRTVLPGARYVEPEPWCRARAVAGWADSHTEALGRPRFELDVDLHAVAACADVAEGARRDDESFASLMLAPQRLELRQRFLAQVLAVQVQASRKGMRAIPGQEPGAARPRRKQGALRPLLPSGRGPGGVQPRAHGADMILCNVNVLVNAHRSDTQKHEAARNLIVGELSSGRAFG